MSAPVTLITGASSDIGLALVRSILASEPEGVILAHTHSGAKRLEALVAESGGGDRVQILPANLRNEASVGDLITTIRERHGYPTRFAHLAGEKLALRRPTALDWPALISDLEVQLRSVWSILAAFLPEMSKSERRCKVAIMLSSVTIGEPPKHMMQYTVVKYALLGLMRSLAVEYAGKPITINGVSPSMVETQFLSEIPARYVEMAAAANPAGRNATVDDVVPALMFLLSAASDHISGVNLPVTAGSPL